MARHGAGGASGEASPEAADGGGAGADGLPKVSHGASEKQRRDRINSMIDQLRALGACCVRCGARCPALTRASQQSSAGRHAQAA